MNIEVKKSFPKLTETTLSKFEKLLEEKFDFKSLPQDYKDFLLQHNGGYIFPNNLVYEDKEFEEEVTFSTPLKFRNGSIDEPSLIMMFTAWIEEDMKEFENTIEDWDIYSIIPSNKYSREDFDILPNFMLSIGLCNNPSSGDILCISLYEEDFGSIYYHPSKSIHPVPFYGDFFKNRTDIIYEKYQINEETDLDDPKYADVNDELKRVNFVKIAENFDEFWRSLKIISY